MGYTVYIKFDKAPKGKARHFEQEYQRAIRAIDRYVKCEAKRGMRLSGYTPHTKGYGGIKFNGVKDEAHEDFVLREHLNQNDSFTFCKTNHKPYTKVVYGALWRLKKYLGDLVDISCDGNLSIKAMKRLSK